MNKFPPLQIQDTNPRLYKPYAFYVLFHEYLHSVGFVDERVCREQAHRVLETLFGIDHLVTQISADTARFFPNLVLDRKSTRLNSSHLVISYAVFCLKKKNKTHERSLVC